MNEKNNLPRVLPPRLYYAAALVTGLLLNRWSPFTFPEITYSKTAGALLMVVLIILFFSKFHNSKKHPTPLYVYKQTTTLVTFGICHFTRNPMYLALILLYTGLAVSFGNLWVLILVIAPLAAVRFLNI